MPGCWEGVAEFDKNGSLDTFRQTLSAAAGAGDTELLLYLQERLTELIAEYEVVCIVVGYPTALSGRKTDATTRTEAFIGELRRRVAVQIETWDERLSSAEAHRVLAGNVRGDKKKVDRVAAMLILQGYLDARRNAPPAQ